MASNNISEDFDDFFDNPKRTVSKHEHVGKSDKNPHQQRNSQNVHERSTSRSISRSTDYSSDASTDSHSDGDSRDRCRRRRSRSPSSRSESSFSSDDSKSRSRRPKGKRNSRSRSSSFSRNRSRSRTDSDGAISEDNNGATEIKVEVNNRRDSNSSAATSDSCAKIDLGQGDHLRSNRRPNDAACSSAWSKDSQPRNSDQDKVTERRSSRDRQNKKKSDKQRHRDRKHSPPSSEGSDITDVSPFSSPSSGGPDGKLESKPPKCLARAPVGRDRSGRSHRDGSNPSSLELNLLMKALTEMEKQTRVQSNTRRVMFEPGRAGRGDQKGNYTFSDHDTQRIEQENQRLLRKIMCHMHTMDWKGPGTRERHPPSTSAASGINRRKDHIRIEKENMAFLKRLEQIKPSKGLSRREQLSAYNSTLLHGVPIPTMYHPTSADTASASKHSGKSSRAGSKAGSEAGSLGRTRSLTSIQSSATTSSTVRSGHSHRSIRSRPSSAKVSLKERPPWDDRW